VNDPPNVLEEPAAYENNAAQFYIDANKYKPQIERYVHEHYKRTVKFDGALTSPTTMVGQVSGPTMPAQSLTLVKQ